MDALICDAVRTPIGRYGGALSAVRTDDLAAMPITALVARNPDVDWGSLDDVIFGAANQAGEDNRNVARMAALLAGLPVSVLGTTINRLCASGMDAVGMLARAIRCGDHDIATAGGVKSMSRAPFVLPKADAAFSRANTVRDTTIGWCFVNPKCRRPMGPSRWHRPLTTWRRTMAPAAPIRTPLPPGRSPDGRQRRRRHVCR